MTISLVLVLNQTEPNIVTTLWTGNPKYLILWPILTYPIEMIKYPSKLDI